MRRVAIFGVGLIGGSFALALRAAGFDGEISGVSSAGTIAAAMEMGVIDTGLDAPSALGRADLIYLAQPILTIIETLRAIGPDIRPGTLVTDAGSTKKQIVAAAGACVRNGLFIGGHPMAGKERSGVREADAALFQDRPYVLTPVRAEDSEAPQFRELREWIVRIGARPITLDADEHDRLVAFTSHAPQLLSTALASVLADIEEAPFVAGPGVLELTRLALSPFQVWRDILQTNDTYVKEALAQLVAKLDHLGRHLASDDLAIEFERAALSARNLREKI